MKKSSTSSKNPNLFNQISNFGNYSYTVVTSKLFPQVEPDDIEKEVDEIMKAKFPDENKEKKAKSTRQSKSPKKRNQTPSIKDKASPKEKDKQIILEPSKINEKNNIERISNEDNEGFTVFLGKNIKSIDEKIAKLIINLKQSLEKITAINPLIKRYEKINYLFRFLECMEWLLIKNHADKALTKDVHSLRKLFIHQLPFFTTQSTLVDEFISLCLAAFEKNLILGNSKNTVTHQFQTRIKNLVASESYLNLLAINTEPSKKPLTGKEIIPPQNVIFEIFEVLTHLSLISDKIESTSSTLHAIATLFCYYWELSNRYFEYQKSRFTDSAKHFQSYDNCLNLLSSHKKSVQKNALTQFAKSFRNHRFAHIGRTMIDENDELRTAIDDSSIYTIVIENRETNGRLEFNPEILLENASSAKDYAQALQDIIPDFKTNKLCP